MDQRLLSISQLAKYVGVTVRAVRHYHSLGLIPEPPRDSSGYRRYGPDAIIKLTQIKILTEAGVPLARIEATIKASPESFAKMIATIKSEISRRIKELQLTKQRLDGLHSGDHMFVSETLANYLDYLREIGLSEATISFERDAWILISALQSKYVELWIKAKQDMLASPEATALYRRLDEARTWSASDTRIEGLAADMMHFAKTSAPVTIAGQSELTRDKQALSLINSYGADTFPAWKKLRETTQLLMDNEAPQKNP